MAEKVQSMYKADILVAIGAVMVVLMLIIPLPAWLLDLLMAMNLVLNLLVLLIVLYTKRAIDFSVFPTVLLVLTLFGLALNVSSTRLILTQGMEFEGRMVRAFSSFVVGTAGTDGLIIGFVIFIILIAVQVFVITKGSTRIAEVAARFTLDGMTTKNMSIESEYNAGLITEDEARIKKEDVKKESDFYGSMDGASKFVSGNVKIGIFITVVNLVAGLIIGMLIRNEPFAQALANYAALTIGDGLLSQLPSLLVSVATGLIVTRAVSTGTFGSDIAEQFSRNAWVFFIGSATLLAISFVPGFPWYILIPLAAGLAWIGFQLRRREAATFKKSFEMARQKETEKSGDHHSDVSPVVPLDPLSLELGYGLIPLVDKDKGAELLERVTRIRRESALDLGLVVPRIRIIDNMRLEPSEYCFKIKGVEVARGRIRMGWYLGINPGGVSEELAGEKTTDPAFGLPAIWITDETRERAERAGYTVVDPPSIIATHLTEVIKRHASEILGRQEVQSIIDTIRKDYPAVVEEVLKSCQLGEIQKVLQGLLREQVSIRNMVVILETLADYRPVTRDSSVLIEKVRQALGRQICLQYADSNRCLHVLTIDPGLTQKIVDSRVDTVQGPVAALEPVVQRTWIRSLIQIVSQVQQSGYLPVLLCPEEARLLVKSSTEREIPDLVVLSVPEIASDIRVEAIGEVKLADT